MRLSAALTSAAMLLSANAFPPLAACTGTTLDCSLNGICVDGSCVCDFGWKGTNCGNISLGMTDPTRGHAFDSGSSSWGGLPIKADDGTWHLFYSQFARGCGLSAWSTNSRIVHAVALTADGPFIDKDVVEPAFSHNAQAMRAIDGTWVVFYIGCGQGEAVRDCGGSPADSLPLAPRTTPPRGPGWNPSKWCSPLEWREALGEGYISYSFASSPDGPWTPLGRPAFVGSNDTRRWDTLTTNPAPFPLADGRVLLGLSGDNGSEGKCIGVAEATSWNGTYIADPIVAMRGGEDPFLWVNQRGDRHIIYHDVAGTSNGGHIYAPATNSTQWTLGTHSLYTGLLQWPNGTSVTVYDRERPKIVFNESGAPVLLYNGLAVYNYLHSFTAVTYFE